MRLKEEWNPMPWQLHACKWNLLNNIPTDYERYRYSSEHYMYLPHTYKRQNGFSYLRKSFVKIMKTISNESAFGCMIFAVICFTFYMHVYILDNTRETHVPTFHHIAVPAKTRVVVAIVMHNPSKFLKTTLKSLNESTHRTDTWIFRNFVGDHIYKDVSQWYPTAKIIADKGRADSKDIMHFVMDKFISSNYEVLVIINSYSVFSFDWWVTLKKSLEQSRGIFTLYGTERDHIHAEMCTEILCYQTWIGNVGSVWRRNLANRMIAETSEISGTFNQKAEHWCKMNSIPMQSVRNSVMAVIDSDKINYEKIRLKLSFRLGQHKLVEDIQKDVSDESQKDGSELIWQSESSNITRHNTTHSIDKTHKLPECIAAVLRVRIHRENKANVTAYEAEQWIRYMQYAGVNIVYLYDAYEQENEKLDLWVKQLFRHSEVKYHDWFFNTSLDIRESERIAYQHALFYYKDDCEWHMQINVNEYPFVSEDVEKGFLKRLIRKIRLSRPNCTEISLPVFQFTGIPVQASWLIERMQSKLPKQVNGFDRPLYIAKFVKAAKHYHNKLDKGGTSEDIDPKIGRINQYLGAGLWSLVQDTNRTLSKTVNDSSMMPIIEHLKQVTLISNKMPLYVTNQYWDSKF